MTRAAPPELSLPDLPEVPVSLGPLGPRPPLRAALPRGGRLRNTLSTYLPLLLMALLAGSTWWLVKHTPQALTSARELPLRSDPDYTMRDFSITRFDPDGRFALRIDGAALRHYPDTDRLEIDGVRIHAVAPDGRSTDASARRALANADGSEVQLLGAARVLSQLGGAETLQIEGEFLHAFVRFERLRSHLPVLVRRGRSEARAGGIDYDNLTRQLQLLGPVRSVLHAGARPIAVEPAASAL